MSRNTILPGAIVALAMLAGCFTISETERPAISPVSVPNTASNLTVAVRGFATTLTEYVTVGGYQTVFYQGGCGPCGYAPGVGTAYTTTTIPQQRACDAFLDQAKSNLESLGFNVMAQVPDYVVEARFSGPVVTGGETAETVAWMVCSLFTCDHAAQTWHAKLRIHDNRTGRLIFSQDYSQRYEVTGFSPIPLVGISGYERTTSKYMQCWCLSALTDRVSAEAATFLTALR